mgnify:CR=1 FL=1
MNKIIYLPAILAVALTACSDTSKDDLIAYMTEVKARPAKPIEPIPTFTPYKPFDYGVTQYRGPFDKPVIAKSLAELLPASSVEPDPDRPKEFLEQFNIESLDMVGTIEKDNELWALLEDNEGNVYYVKKGNYLGKNHGKIVVSEPTYIQVVEIVNNGSDGWVERPRTIELEEE